MMNAAMMIAPAPQPGTVQFGGKAAAEQEPLFGQALAQQEQQVVYQTPEQEQTALFGVPGKGLLLSNFSELLGKDAGESLAQQTQQQDLLEQRGKLHMEWLDSVALLLEQGAVPNSMDHAQLQQLVDLVEEVLPEWPFHNQVVAEQNSGQELLPEQQDPALEQKVEELIAWFDQYQEQQVQHHPGKGIVGDLPPGQLVAAQQLEQVRERLTQLRASLAETGNKAEPAKVEGEAKGHQMAAAAVRGAAMAGHKESPESPLEARFSELLKPRPPQVAPPQVAEAGRQLSQVQTNQAASDDAVEAFFAKVAEKNGGQIPVAQMAMNAKPGSEVVMSQHGQLPGQPTPLVNAAQHIAAPAAVAAPFAASAQVTDSQIFDQVVTHLSGSAKGDMGRMVLRLHPAELGSLRIELMVEGDKVRANLHAQTQQVQEVLERNLGQLRNSLAEQGLKIDHFQVSSDARQHQQQGPAEDLAHQRQAAEQSAQHRRAHKEEPLVEDQAIPLTHLIQNGGRGISLHV
ncbi:flagellar hook-length control protein FliK [Pelovirga terrestris]|uniref:Flagellar hook-length control protein FliK n=1 Tax=Pelovirga terrestris TaxID=2771352 RepID=A0A8J6QUL5_9BACT|nr:flagellar hook-length control protein FliK [Pelovirga terrestris]MBD1400430.1 flagellar hook-length control protein FliK [Pelovirga terrestris]